MRYYEDLEVGAVARFGQRHVTREEVVEFAGKYDPQPFHLSDEAAAATHFGRLSASGWHTCAMTMAMIVEEQDRAGHQGLGSPGIDELRWRHPVYPGDPRGNHDPEQAAQPNPPGNGPVPRRNTRAQPG